MDKPHPTERRGDEEPNTVAVIAAYLRKLLKELGVKP